MCDCTEKDKQIELYRDYRKRYSKQYEWIMQIDIDKMVVLYKPNDSLPLLLDRYSKLPRVHWVVSFPWRVTCTWKEISHHSILCGSKYTNNVFPLSRTYLDHEIVKSAYATNGLYTRHSIHDMGTFAPLKIVAKEAVLYHFFVRSLLDFLLAKFANNNDWPGSMTLLEKQLY